MLNVHSNATSDPQVAPDFEELEEKSKIPFNFLHLPFCLIDEDIIASLDGPTVKVLTVITRYVNLTEKIRVGKRVLLSGWGIPISYEHIAKKAGVSRRTAIRKVKILIERDILQVDKVGRCNCYRLTEYAIGIDEVRKAYEQVAAGGSSNGEPEPACGFRRSGAGFDATAEQRSCGGRPPQEQTKPTAHREAPAPETEPSPPESEPVIRPGVPNDEQIRAFIQQEVVSAVSPLLDEIVSRLSPFIDSPFKDTNPLSHRQEGKNPTLSINQLKALHPDWEAYQPYTEAFYGEVPSKKLLVTACIYFKELAATVGVAPDGGDRLMRMIELVKAMGAYHHTCFDQQFGVEAFARVKEEESVRLRQQTEADERKANHEADDQDTETDSDDENPLDDEEQRSSSDLSSRPPRDAKETVAARVYARFCMASAGLGKPYTEVDVQQLFKEEYARFGEPPSAAQWVEDRLFVRQQLVDNAIRQPYTTEELKALSQEALRLYPQPSSCPL